MRPSRLAYPARLEIALQKRLPGVAVKVISMAKPRQTAQEMADGFPKILKDEKPALVVWQTGTADAMRGIGAESFQATLEGAVDKLQAGGADVIFMNMQYSPRTDAVISTAAYADAIRWVALEHALNLFDRQGVMRQWSEFGTFDLLAATKSLVNYGFYIGATVDNLDELRRAERTPGIKIFIGSSTGDLLVDEQAALERIFAETTPVNATAAA